MRTRGLGRLGTAVLLLLVSACVAGADGADPGPGSAEGKGDQAVERQFVYPATPDLWFPSPEDLASVGIEPTSDGQVWRAEAEDFSAARYQFHGWEVNGHDFIRVALDTGSTFDPVLLLRVFVPRDETGYGQRCERLELSRTDDGLYRAAVRLAPRAGKFSEQLLKASRPGGYLYVTSEQVYERVRECPPISGRWLPDSDEVVDEEAAYEIASMTIADWTEQPIETIRAEACGGVWPSMLGCSPEDPDELDLPAEVAAKDEDGSTTATFTIGLSPERFTQSLTIWTRGEGARLRAYTIHHRDQGEETLPAGVHGATREEDFHGAFRPTTLQITGHAASVDLEFEVPGSDRLTVEEVTASQFDGDLAGWQDLSEPQP